MTNIFNREPARLDNAAALASVLAQKRISSVLLVTQRAALEQGLTIGVEQALVAGRIDCTIVEAEAPLSRESVQAAKEAYRQGGCRAILALGGAAIDCAKLVAHALRSKGAAPGIYAIPADYSDGAATPLALAENTLLRCGALMPAAVLADPSLTRGLSRAEIAVSGMTTLTHALEAALCPAAGKAVRARAEEALALLVRNLARVWEDSGDEAARAELLQAALHAGWAFTRARGGIHGIAGALSSRYGIPYGEVCGALLPEELERREETLRKPLAALARKTSLAPMDADDVGAAAALIAWVQELPVAFDMPERFEEIRAMDLHALGCSAAEESCRFPRYAQRQATAQRIGELMAQPEERETDAQRIVARQRDFFSQGRTLSLCYRRDALLRLQTAIRAHEAEIAQALRSDLGKGEQEGYMCEIGMTLAELSWMLRHVRGHMRRRRVLTPLAQFSAESFTVRNPYGVTLIMSPWNYPFMLTMEPLIGAIAAGNCCVVKPSAYAPATSAVIRDLCAECFPQEHVAVVEGGRAENQALLAQTFDKIFFTGSPAVGQEVLRRAAESYTPVTLELGGKSPVYVDRTAKLPLAARRIAFGKLLNAGQTCVAPDYILVDRSVRDELVALLKKEFTAQAGENALENPDYVHMINQRHFERVSGLIDPEKVVFGGQGDGVTLRIQPTILDGVSPEDACMQEEIFGPVLPVIAVDSAEEAVAFINARPHPLACYLFSQDRAQQERFLHAVPFGGGCINDTVIHLATSRMGFGGLGQSGMGSYHGQRSLEAFSHEKAIVKKHTWMDMPIRYAPYAPWKSRLVRFFLR